MGIDEQALSSGVTSMSFADEGGAELLVERLKEPIRFTMGLDRGADVSAAVCRYWKAWSAEAETNGEYSHLSATEIRSVMNSGGSWVTDGLLAHAVEMHRDGRITLHCETSHLSDFAGGSKEIVPEMNTVDPVGDASLLLDYNWSNMGPALVLLGICAFFLSAHVGSRRLDVKQHAKLMALQERVFVNTGEMGKDAEPEEEQPARLWDKFKLEMRSSHSIVSIIDPPMHELLSMSRPQRNQALLASIMIGFMVNAIFHGTEEQSTG